MCQHNPACPSPEGPDRAAARIRAAFPGQGWSLLCNGVVLFDDAGAILPDRRVTQPGATDPARLTEPARLTGPAKPALAQAAVAHAPLTPSRRRTEPVRLAHAA
ncbi:MAG: hypothetical protein JWO79_4208 [Actinomycetia bacterium]|jgi:hypothetical protein|nr:hypothetical protein [Actinomycetes bacterium]MDQ1659229.1 hypothetical protein [Cryptosporangiaceae bacterium]